MNDKHYESKKREIHEVFKKYGFGYTLEQSCLSYCEYMLKKASGYALSHTENLAFNGVRALVKKDKTPTKLGFKFLCNVYYKHSNLQSDGCVWAKKYRCENS